MSEARLLADVLIAITALPGTMFTRQNTGAAWDWTGRMIRFGRPGQPDIRGCYRGRYVDIETKSARGAQSEEQRRWQVAVEHAGGIYILARSVEQVLQELERCDAARLSGSASGGHPSRMA